MHTPRKFVVYAYKEKWGLQIGNRKKLKEHQINDDEPDEKYIFIIVNIEPTIDRTGAIINIQMLFIFMCYNIFLLWYISFPSNTPLQVFVCPTTTL